MKHTTMKSTKAILLGWALAALVGTGAPLQSLQAADAPPTLTGTVRRPDGRPAAGLEVRLIGFEPGRRHENLETDAEGKFELELTPGLFEQNRWTPCLFIRDPERNLAVAQELDENTTNLDLKLAPALTLAGRVESEGKPVTNLNVQVVFWSGRSGLWLRDLARTNTPGQYEVPALPPGRRYGLVVSAPGYGQKQNHNLEVSAEPGRQELEMVELKPANLKLAGQVLDTEDKPVANCSVSLNGNGQANAHTRTDREGRFRFEVCEGTVQVYANSQGAQGNISAEGGDTNVVLRLGESSSSYSGITTHTLTGLITDTQGKPVAGAQVTVFPNQNGTHWLKTGTNGQYRLNWSLQPWQAQNGQAYLAVRDLAHDLAAVEELSEETTNLNVQLKPALTLSGLVKNSAGAPMGGAEVGLWFKAGNSYEQVEERLKSANAQGRFEIPCLPAAGHYMIWATAKGYGKLQRPVDQEADTNHLELAPFVLKPADRVIAGQILKGDDQPATGVNIQLSGDGQPDGQSTTDRQGRFHFRVCEGAIRLFAYQDGGGTAQATVEAGDTNMVMHIGAGAARIHSAPSRTALKGNPLPDLAAVNLASDAAPAGQPVLLCLFDAGQRPSRRLLRQLEEQAAALRAQKVCVLGIQSAVTTEEAFNEWKAASPVSFPLGRVADKAGKAKWAAAVPALPWLVLTDASHQVIAEGFDFSELEAQLKKLAK